MIKTVRKILCGTIKLLLFKNHLIIVLVTFEMMSECDFSNTL